ncbi:hypothetical protein RHMOL_Rhmol04G0196600 [Rhododendron molle]|uniref:Uncharacterized protein n=1 Tax=Rhododendron molle TaxID=49168 RepID=A0ACC0P421_RHOML|nr:hypothetical protein RHMOL_Rhmol04G0196600 [Rhododendron molle]
MQTPMADHGDGGGEEEVVDRLEDRGGPMEVNTGDQQPAEAGGVEGAVVAGHDKGDGGCEQEVGGGDERRPTEAEPRAIKEARAVEPVVRPLDPNMTVASSVVSSGGSRNAGSSGDGRVIEETGAAGPSIEPVDSTTVAEDSPVIDGSSVSAGGSGAAGDDSGPIGSPPRDLARGK